MGLIVKQADAEVSLFSDLLKQLEIDREPDARRYSGSITAGLVEGPGGSCCIPRIIARKGANAASGWGESG